MDERGRAQYCVFFDQETSRVILASYYNYSYVYWIITVYFYRAGLKISTLGKLATKNTLFDQSIECIAEVVDCRFLLIKMFFELDKIFSKSFKEIKIK